MKHSALQRKFVLSFLLALSIIVSGCSSLAKLGPALEPTQHIKGHVIRVYDGDTILIVDRSGHGPSTRIRLKGIDAPESSQDYGPEATKRMTELCLGEDVDIA